MPYTGYCKKILDQRGRHPHPTRGLDLDSRLRNLERAAFEEAIRRKDGNREAAARLLGVRPHISETGKGEVWAVISLDNGIASN